jgi:primary-amine oxidase
MWITPHNYLLSDPSRQSKQMIHIGLDEEGVATDVNTYGAEAVTGGVDFVRNTSVGRGRANKTKAQIEWDATSYTGDVAIRKFPYDRKYLYQIERSVIDKK